MAQEDKYIIEKLYIMNVKTLQIVKVTVNEVDECKFALFNFIDKRCHYDLRGSYIQILAYSPGFSSQRYIVSKDIKSLLWLKESLQWLIGDIGFALLDTWNKVYDEKFNAYNRIK